MRLLIALIGLIPGLLFAQTLGTSVNVSWVAPTQNTDGSAISGALTYTLYQGPSPNGPFSVAATGITGTSTVLTSLKLGNCFTLAAVESVGASSNTSSDPTTPICLPVPNSPSGLSISIVLTIMPPSSATQSPVKTSK